MLTLLAQIPLQDDRGEIASDLRATVESARAEGIRVHSLPLDLSGYSADELVSSLPATDGFSLFSGYILDDGMCNGLERALRSRGVTPVNSADDTLQALRFSVFYPLLADLTAESAIAWTREEALAAADSFGLPLFVKGDVKSFKEQGWSACTISDRSQIERLQERHFPLVMRRLLPLRRAGEERNGFPVSREYRFYLYRTQLLGGGYYWSDADPFGPLTASERDQAESLAVEAASRLRAPLVVVDVGQLDDGSFRVIEVGDPQFSGVAHMPRALFWRQLLNAL